MIKGPIHLEAIIILNVYVPNSKDSKYQKTHNNGRNERIEQIFNYSWNFNILPSKFYRESRLEIINKYIECLNTTINLPDIQRILYPHWQNVSLFKCTQNIHQGKPHSGHKTSLNIFKRTEII